MAPANQSANAPPYWEYILREFVFKTISPPPSSNINLYKRLLDAPLYGGPFPTGPNDGGSAVLSRGDVYYLPNSNWLLCQEGCVDCEVCTEHTHPVLKWVLRRIKRLPVHGQERQDLQLTLIPRIDGSHLMRSLWPRSHVYVTTPGELEAFLSDRLARQGLDNQDDSLGEPRKSSNFWRFVERDSLPERRVLGEQSNDTGPPETDAPGSDSTASDRENARNTTSTEVSERTRVKLPDRPTGNDSVSTPVAENARNRSKLLLLPKLILGTDQLGQKHLVHVVPADGTSAGNSTSPGLMAALSTAGSGRIQNRTAYQRILKRIYDSLSSNKRSIESFLDPPSQTDRRKEMYQQQETRHSLAGLKQLDRLHRDYKETIRNESQRWPSVLNWSRQRRKSNDEADVEKLIIDPSNNDLDPDRNINNISLTASNRSNTVQNTKHGPRVFKVVVSTESTTKPLNKSDADFGRDIARSDNRFNYNSTMNTGGDPMSVSMINRPQ
ncbi:uncharacterized protein LOC143356004 [Halictus rubicundus]|uniref:uncharacterized protein LOC143356004 n=1 Tax=Halictus rubicundus TaxID=77578 RepID=UPI004036DCB5